MFLEELPLPVVGKVVSKDSATLEGYNPISIHANHRHMVRFSTANDSGCTLQFSNDGRILCTAYRETAISSHFTCFYANLFRD